MSPCADYALLRPAVILTVGWTALMADRLHGQCVQEHVQLTGGDIAYNYFGMSVSISGDVAVARAASADCPAPYGYGAVYFYRFDGDAWIQEARDCAPGAWSIDLGGRSVAVSNNVALMGTSSSGCCGSVRVYQFNPGATPPLVETQTLSASDAQAYDAFGASVAISGDASLIGTRKNAAYLFRYSPGAPGQWVEEQKLVPLSPAGRLGSGVAIDGDVAVVSAYVDQCAVAPECGVAYIFRHTGGVWNEDALLVPATATTDDHGGGAVAISGNVVLVQEPSRSAVSVFRHTGGSWLHEQRLVASDSSLDGSFGEALSIQGDLVIVGRPAAHCIGPGARCGALYVYRFDGVTWVEEAKLTASDAKPFDEMGGSLSVSGQWVIAGAAWRECVAGESCGAAYLYSLEPSPTPPDCNGNGVDDGCDVAYQTSADCNGNFIPDECDVAACSGDPACADCNANAVPDGCEPDCNANWIADACDIAACPGQPACADCNANLVPDGCDIHAGSSADDDANGVPDDCEPGACCNEATGVCDQALAASACDGEERGWHVNQSCAELDPPCDQRTGACCDFGTGACRENVPLGSCAESFQQWFRLQTCNEVGCSGQTAAPCVAASLLPEGAIGIEDFGYSTSIDGEVAVVGAPLADCPIGENCGAAYAYRFVGDTWLQEQALSAPDASAGAFFGASVGVSGAVIVVGAHGADCSYCGAAYVFRFDGQTWVFEQKLGPEGVQPSDDFGWTLSIDDDAILIGAYGRDTAAGADSGAVYAYRHDGAVWVLEQELLASDAGPDDGFGISLSVSNGVAVIGSWQSDCGDGADCGKAYFFRRNPDTGIWLEEQQVALPRDWAVMDVSIRSDVALVSSIWVYCPPDTGTICRDVRLYRFDSWANAWLLEQVFLPRNPYSWFGTCLSAGPSAVAIGGWSDYCTASGCQDVAYVFGFNGRTWVLRELLTAPNLPANRKFGVSASLSGDAAIVGATDDFCETGENCGAAYVFSLGPDCNANGDADFCDLRDGLGADCQPNGVLDACDVAPGTSDDCQCTGMPDECDIALGLSDDSNANAVPDECEFGVPVWAWSEASAANRSLVVRAESPAAPSCVGTALQVAMIDLHDPSPPYPTGPAADFSAFEQPTCTAAGENEACVRWVGPAQTFLESADAPSLGPLRAARLQCTPYYADWTTLGEIVLMGAEILPSSSYALRAFAPACQGQESGCAQIGEPWPVTTRRWADVAEPFNPPSGSAQPDSLDVVALVNKFKGLPGSPSKAFTLLQPNAPPPFADVSALDIAASVDAFKGFAYPYSGPCVCPSTVPCNATPCANAGNCTGLYGAGATCVKTCTSGPNLGSPCGSALHCGQCAGGARLGYPCDADADCPDSTCTLGNCGSGFCRDRCGRCN